MHTLKSAPVPPQKANGALVSELCLSFPLYPNLTDPTAPLTVVAMTLKLLTLIVAVFTTIPSVKISKGRSVIALYKIKVSTLPTTTVCKVLLLAPPISDVTLSASTTSLVKQTERVTSNNTNDDDAIPNSIFVYFFVVDRSCLEMRV